MSFGSSGMSAGEEAFDDAYQGDAPANFFHSGKILIAKVNQALDSKNVMSSPIQNSFVMINNGKLLRNVGFDKYRDSFLAGFDKYYDSFLFLGHSCQIKDRNNTQMYGIHKEGLNLHLTLATATRRRQIRLSLAEGMKDL